MTILSSLIQQQNYQQVWRSITDVSDLDIFSMVRVNPPIHYLLPIALVQNGSCLKL